MKRSSIAFFTAAFAGLAIAGTAHAETLLRGVGIAPDGGAYSANTRIVVSRDGAKLVINEQTVKVPVRLGGHINNVSKAYVIAYAKVNAEDINGKGADYSVMPRTPDVRSIDGKQILYLRKGHLGGAGAQALKVCGAHKGTEAKVYPLDYNLALEVGAIKKSNVPAEVGLPFTQAYDEAVVTKAYTTVKGDVLCPGKPAPAALPVASASLRVIRTNQACPAKVVLQANFTTIAAGPISFVLKRSDGEHMTVDAVATKQGSAFAGSYNRSYEIKQDTMRKYRLERMDGTALTDWVDMNIKCQTGPKGLTN